MDNNNNCGTMVTNTGAESKEEEVELELGLSIGGSHRRPDKLKPIKKESMPFLHGNDMICNSIDTDLTGSSVSPGLNGDAEQETDPRTKREIHAMRRQEAKKKREEKQQKRSVCRGKNGECGNDNDGMLLKATSTQSRECQIDAEERDCKKSKTDSGSGRNAIKNISMNWSIEQDINHLNMCSNPMMATSSQVMQVQYYPQPPLQYINGFAYTCMNVNGMPSWAQGGGNRGNVVQAAGMSSFRPFQAVLDEKSYCQFY